MSEEVRVKRLEVFEPRDIRQLGDVTIDCVEGGASIGFILPMTRDKAETFWRNAGKTLLVLDTASGDARRLYVRQGWQFCGRIPNYALFPDGRPSATDVFFKSLDR